MWRIFRSINFEGSSLSKSNGFDAKKCSVDGIVYVVNMA